MSDSIGTSPTPIGDAPISSPVEATGSAAGSLQNDGGILTVDAAAAYDPESGFQRDEFGKETLAGTVQFHERHVFLCYKNPQVWPSHLESSESDRLPRLLSAAIKSRKKEMNKSVRVMILNLFRFNFYNDWLGLLRGVYLFIEYECLIFVDCALFLVYEWWYSIWIWLSDLCGIVLYFSPDSRQ